MDKHDGHAKAVGTLHHLGPLPKIPVGYCFHHELPLLRKKWGKRITYFLRPLGVSVSHRCCERCHGIVGITTHCAVSRQTTLLASTKRNLSVSQATVPPAPTTTSERSAGAHSATAVESVPGR